MTVTTWPDPARPGVPLNPERDGWHWVRRTENNTPFPLQWTNDWTGSRDYCWAIMGSGEPEDVAKNFCYLGPCLTPDGTAALQARIAELEAAVQKKGCARDQNTTQFCAEAVALQARVAKLGRLVQILLDEDPNDMAADAVTVLDVWRKEARAALEGKKDER